jgi:muramidase (phage lysozyme)
MSKGQAAQLSKKSAHELANYPQLKAIGDLIGFAEGADYNTLFGGGKFGSYDNHPNRRITKGKYTSSASGKFQIMDFNWFGRGNAKGLKERLNLPDFSPKSQDVAMVQLIKDAGALVDVLSGNWASAIFKLRNVWASFPGNNYGQGGKSLQTLLRVLNQLLKKHNLKANAPNEFKVASAGVSDMGEALFASNPEFNPSPIKKQNFNAPKGVADQLQKTQIQNNQVSQDLNSLQRDLDIATKKDELDKLFKTINQDLLKTTQSIEDSKIATDELIQNAKGYLTVNEQINKSASDLNKTYIDRIRAIDDEIKGLDEKASGYETLALTAKKVLAEQQNLSLEERKSYQNQIDSLPTIQEKFKYLKGQKEIEKDILETNKERAILTDRQLNVEKNRIESLTKIADLEDNIATAKYNQGGTLINEASIIKARIDGIKMLRDAQLAYQNDNSLGGDYVTKTKELADINLSQSYVDAIPFLKEFSTGLKDVVLRTSTWQESLKKLFDLANSTVIDQFLIKPFQNMIAGVAKDWGLFSGEAPEMNAPKVASDLIQNNIVPTGQFGVGAVSQDQIVTDSLKTFNDAIGNSTEVIPTAIQSITDGSLTQGVAITSFTQGLIQATLALQSFTLGAGGQSVSTGLGGIFGSLFNSGNATAGASLGNALSGGYSGILQGILPFAKGGPIINRADGGPVEIGMNAIAALQKEKALNGGQPTALIAATVGEYVLTKEQASDYLAEKENAHRWNNLQSQNTQVMNRASGGPVGNVSQSAPRSGTVNNVGGQVINITLESRNDLGYSLSQIDKRRQLEIDRSVRRFS